ncbi:unnamed protein product, partial [Adineta steineri]
TFVKPPAQVQKVFDSYLELNDIENVQYYYPATAVLIISRYSDNIVVVKKEANTYFQYTGDTYSDRISLSYNKLCDHFDTSGKILVFHQRQVIIFIFAGQFLPIQTRFLSAFQDERHLL